MINTNLYKKMLCNNIIKEGDCSYKSKCMYAHSLEEQKLYPIRQKAYDLYKQSDLSHIDLNKDPDLYQTLISLTNICSKCNNNTCPGGYNCKHGAVDYAHKLCINDLLNSSCSNANCKFIHFTAKGLKTVNNLLSTEYNNTSNYYSDSESLESEFDRSSASETDINSIFKYH